MCLYECVRTSLSPSGCVIVRGCASCTRPLTEVSCRAAVFWSSHVGVNILDQEVGGKKRGQVERRWIDSFQEQRISSVLSDNI